MLSNANILRENPHGKSLYFSHTAILLSFAFEYSFCRNRSSSAAAALSEIVTKTEWIFSVCDVESREHTTAQLASTIDTEGTEYRSTVPNRAPLSQPAALCVLNEICQWIYITIVLQLDVVVVGVRCVRIFVWRWQWHNVLWVKRAITVLRIQFLCMLHRAPMCILYFAHTPHMVHRTYLYTIYSLFRWQ